MKINEFIEAIKNINVNINDEILKSLEIYSKELKQYNEHTNLTAIKEIEDIYLKHFFDSILVAKYVDFKNIESIIDIGTGAGFPGLVLKIFFPHLKVTLLDSNNKKTKFLEYISDKLNLNDIEIVNDRAENFIKTKRHSYDLCISRAVSELRIILELGLPFVKLDGKLVALKGNYEKEYEHVEETLKVLDAQLVNIQEDILPIEESRRTFLIYKNNKLISNEYPRTYEKIKKKPLKYTCK